MKRSKMKWYKINESFDATEGSRINPQQMKRKFEQCGLVPQIKRIHKLLDSLDKEDLKRLGETPEFDYDEFYSPEFGHIYHKKSGISFDQEAGLYIGVMEDPHEWFGFNEKGQADWDWHGFDHRYDGVDYTFYDDSDGDTPEEAAQEVEGLFEDFQSGFRGFAQDLTKHLFN